MLTKLHIVALQDYVKQGNAAGIHDLLTHCSVADQKQGKQIVARTMANRRDCSLQQSIEIYSALLQYDLNLYFKTFLLYGETLRDEAAFWGNLSLLNKVGELLQKNRPYYRQQLLNCWLCKLNKDKDAAELLKVMRINDVKAKMSYLLQAATLYAYYLLIVIALQQDAETAYLKKCCTHILSTPDSAVPIGVRRDVVNFMVQYFNIPDTNLRFFHKLEVGTFSYAERSYESFVKVIIPAERIQHFVNVL